MVFRTVLTASFIAFFALSGIAPALAAEQESQAAQPQAQQQGSSGGFFSIFNSKKSSGGAKPIYLNQGTDSNYRQPQGGDARPYTGYSGTNYSRVTEPSFGEAMAALGAENQANAAAAGAELQKQTDAAIAAERARINQFREAYDGAGKGGAKNPPEKDNRKMVYEKKERKPGAPIRLFDLR